MQAVRAASALVLIVSAATASAELSAGQKAAIGRKIWQNECAGTVDGLTSWNAGEEFPSLGIGHFIWYPAGFNGPFTESWPQLVAFAKQRGANPPAVASLPNCPWDSKKQFQAEFRGPQLTALRKWLKSAALLCSGFLRLTFMRLPTSGSRPVASTTKRGRHSRIFPAPSVATTRGGVERSPRSSSFMRQR